MSFSINFKEKYNNDIIYFIPNCKIKEIFFFEKNIIGSFLYCKDINSFKLLRKEILNKKKRSPDLIFNIITSGSSFKDLQNIIEENKDFENCIKNICIFCYAIDKYKKYQDECKKIFGVYKEPKDVLEFLTKTQTKNHYFKTKIIINCYYIQFYKSRHFQIAQFYENLNPDIYRENIEKIKTIIKREDDEKKLSGNLNKIIEGFLKFELKNDSQNSDELIIKEYTNGTFDVYLNECLKNIDQELDESVAYFTSRLIFSLNSYALKNNMFFIKDKEKLYSGIKLPYSKILSYEKVKGQIITFPHFISTTENEFLAKNWARRGDSIELYNITLNFSVLFIITNIYNSNLISNGINIQNISVYKGEKEILFLPFSFFKVNEVIVDINNYTADIHLETVGKNEILETQIKKGKQIEYNKELNIMKTID